MIDSPLCILAKRMCVFCRVVLLFRITWLVRKGLGKELYFCSHRQIPLWRDRPLHLQYSNQFQGGKRRKNLLQGKWKNIYLIWNWVCSSPCTLQTDNTFFEGWYFIQSLRHTAKMFGRNDTCLFYRSMYESAARLLCKSWLLEASPQLSKRVLLLLPNLQELCLYEHARKD